MFVDSFFLKKLRLLKLHIFECVGIKKLCYFLVQKSFIHFILVFQRNYFKDIWVGNEQNSDGGCDKIIMKRGKEKVTSRKCEYGDDCDEPCIVDQQWILISSSFIQFFAIQLSKMKLSVKRVWRFCSQVFFVRSHRYPYFHMLCEGRRFYSIKNMEYVHKTRKDSFRVRFS